jgi:hypothetical protein
MLPFSKQRLESRTKTTGKVDQRTHQTLPGHKRRGQLDQSWQHKCSTISLLDQCQRSSLTTEKEHFVRQVEVRSGFMAFSVSVSVQIRRRSIIVTFAATSGTSYAKQLCSTVKTMKYRSFVVQNASLRTSASSKTSNKRKRIQQTNFVVLRERTTKDDEILVHENYQHR